MITHRMATQREESPARVYKIIAISFLCLAVVLLGFIFVLTTKKVTITVTAKEDTQSVALTVPVSATGGTGNIAGTVTTAPFAWSAQYQPTGQQSANGLATGQVTIYNTTNSSQPLVKTTRLLTPSGVLFRLSESTVVPANGSVVVPVYADQVGAASDIGPSSFTIPGLDSSKQKVIYAQSQGAMQGGGGTVTAVTAADITNANQDYNQKMEAAFMATLPNDGLAHAVTIASQTVAADHHAGDAASSFSLAGTSTLIVVSYKPADLTALINQNAASKIDPAAERFLTLTKNPSVTVSHYSLTDNSAELSVNQDIVVTLDANVPKLAPTNFTGKSKTDIERYILGLNHVAGVTAAFSPSWLTAAPSDASKITVIVNDVK